MVLRNKKVLDIFRLEEIIDLLIDYDVEHFNIDTSKIFGEFLYGYIDFFEKRIYINSRIDYRSARETIIHEFVHALKNKYSIKDNERETEREAREIYKRLYVDKVDNIYLIGGEKNENKE